MACLKAMFPSLDLAELAVSKIESRFGGRCSAKIKRKTVPSMSESDMVASSWAFTGNLLFGGESPVLPMPAPTDSSEIVEGECDVEVQCPQDKLPLMRTYLRSLGAVSIR